MNDKGIAVLVVRLMGLYIVVQAIISIPGYLHLLSSDINEPFTRAAIRSNFMTTIWHLLVGGSLWHWSTPLGALITRALPETAVNSDFSLEAIQRIAVSLLGLFVLTTAVPELLSVLGAWIFPKSSPKYMYSFGLSGEPKAEIPWTEFFKVGAQLAIGFWLTLGSKGIVTIIKEAWEKEKNT